MKKKIRKFKVIKKSKKIKKFKKKTSKFKLSRKPRKLPKKRKKISSYKFKKAKKKKVKNIKNKIVYSKIQKESLVSKFVKLQISLKPQFNFKVNFKLEEYIQGFFDKISETISNYKILKHDEKRRLKLEKIENERKAKIESERQKKRRRF